MANTNAPRGLIPYRRASGEPYNSPGNVYWVNGSYATALYVGDPVQIIAGASDGNGIPSIQLVTPGNGTDTGISTYGLIGSIAGVIPGGSPQVPVLQSQPVYVPASVGGNGTYVLVSDDPDALFVVQANTDWSTGTYTPGSVLGPGKNVDLVSGTGSTVTGYSGWVLGATLSTTALQMKVLRLLMQSDNALGIYSKWLCRINLNQLNNTTGT
jgi:hypothetical protein